MGPVVVKQKRGVSGLHAQPSQWRSFRKAGRCLLKKKTKNKTEIQIKAN